MTFHRFLNTSSCPFLRYSPVYFGELISPQSPDNGSTATVVKDRKHGKRWLGLKYLWLFSVLTVWVLTVMAHYCDPFSNKSPDVLLSVVTWRCEVKYMPSLYLNTLLCFFPLYSQSLKHISACLSIDLHPFWYILLLLFFSTILANIIFFKSLYSISVLALSLPSLPTPYPISFHLCPTVRMIDWWLPPQYLTVIKKSPTI